LLQSADGLAKAVIIKPLGAVQEFYSEDVAQHSPAAMPAVVATVSEPLQAAAAGTPAAVQPAAAAAPTAPPPVWYLDKWVMAERPMHKVLFELDAMLICEGIWSVMVARRLLHVMSVV
jgi:hypothetical protein